MTLVPFKIDMKACICRIKDQKQTFFSNWEVLTTIFSLTFICKQLFYNFWRNWSLALSQLAPWQQVFYLTSHNTKTKLEHLTNQATHLIRGRRSRDSFVERQVVINSVKTMNRPQCQTSPVFFSSSNWNHINLIKRGPLKLEIQINWLSKN